MSSPRRLALRAARSPWSPAHRGLEAPATPARHLTTTPEDRTIPSREAALACATAPLPPAPGPIQASPFDALRGPVGHPSAPWEPPRAPSSLLASAGLTLLALLALLLWSPQAQAQWLWYPYASDIAVSQGYHSGHKAIDFASGCGTAIYAAYDGIVTAVVENHTCRHCYACYSGCGDAYVNGGCQNNYIYIDHPNGYQTRYLHIEVGGAEVSVGQEVRAGQRIGRSGNVGWTCGNTGCHLHFELRDGNRNGVDPGGHWTNPRQYGDSAPPRDESPPSCGFPAGPETGRVHRDGGLRVEWRVEDGGSGLRGASQSWDSPIPADSGHQFDSGGRARHDGYLELGWAGVGKHRAYVRAWDREGNTCQADAGEYWYYPEPFERDFLLAGPLETDGGERDRLSSEPLGDEGALMPRPGDGAGPTSWSPHQDDDDHIDLDAIFGGDQRLAYAATYCYNPGEDRDVDLHFGSDDGARVYVNGQRVVDAPQPRGAAPDQDRARVRLQRGWNPIVIKVEEKGGGWGFYLRLADGDRRPEGVTCTGDFTRGPCIDDFGCPGQTVCLDGRCQDAPDEPVDPPDAGAPDAQPEDPDDNPDGGLPDPGDDASPDNPGDDPSDDRPDGDGPVLIGDSRGEGPQASVKNACATPGGATPVDTPWLALALAALVAWRRRRNPTDPA